MQISRLIRAVLLVLTTAKLIHRQTLADAVSNQANVSSSSPTTLTWSRSVRKPQLNSTSKTKKIVARQADGNNSSANNRAAPNERAAAQTAKPRDEEDNDSSGISLVYKYKVFDLRFGSALTSRHRYRTVHTLYVTLKGWVYV